MLSYPVCQQMAGDDDPDEEFMNVELKKIEKKNEKSGKKSH